MKVIIVVSSQFHLLFHLAIDVGVPVVGYILAQSKFNLIQDDKSCLQDN